MTRAEEALFIGGALGKREKEPAADSWYARLAPLFAGDAAGGPDLGRAARMGRARAGHLPQRDQLHRGPRAVCPAGRRARSVPSRARRGRSRRRRPARSEAADPPLPPGMRGCGCPARRADPPAARAAARLSRGSCARRRRWPGLHATPQSWRRQSEARSLARVSAVLDAPDWAELFSPAALAEVPLAAVVGGQVIAGTADRLLVERDRVLVADFKTARRPPASLAEVPASTLGRWPPTPRRSRLSIPGRRIEAALLYTQTPLLIALPAGIARRAQTGLGGGRRKACPAEPLPAQHRRLDLPHTR